MACASTDSLDRKILSAMMRGADVTEVFSPGNIAATCRRYGLAPDSHMDLHKDCDLLSPTGRRKAWEAITRNEPYLLIGGSHKDGNMSKIQAISTPLTAVRCIDYS